MATPLLVSSSPLPRSSLNDPENALTYPQDLSPPWTAGCLLKGTTRSNVQRGRRVATRIDPLSDCLKSVMFDVQMMSIRARSSQELAAPPGSLELAAARSLELGA